MGIFNSKPKKPPSQKYKYYNDPKKTNTKFNDHNNKSNNNQHENSAKQIIIYSNGDRYEGDVVNAQLHGYGTYHYANKDIYKGEWQNNKKHGNGTHYYIKDCKRYIGEWAYGFYHGKGILYDSSQSYFKGIFLEGEKHGIGHFHDLENNEVYEETWENGELKDRRLIQIEKTDHNGSKENNSCRPHSKQDILGKSKSHGIDDSNSSTCDRSNNRHLHKSHNNKSRNHSNSLLPKSSSKEHSYEKNKESIEDYEYDSLGSNYSQNIDDFHKKNKERERKQNKTNSKANNDRDRSDKIEQLPIATFDSNSYEDKILHSHPVMHQSQGDMIESVMSSETRTIELGFDTLNVIEHMDQLNSAANILLNQSSKQFCLNKFPHNSCSVNDWTMDDVNEWLKRIGLGEYVEEFRKNHITGRNLLDLTDTELKDDLKILSVGHRKDFHKAVENLKKIYSSSSKKNSDYIRKKVQKFYEKNKHKLRLGNFNSFERYQSYRNFYSRTQYESKHEVIEEDQDEGSLKFETQSLQPDSMADDHKRDNVDSPTLKRLCGVNNGEKCGYLEAFDLDDPMPSSRKKHSPEDSKNEELCLDTEISKQHKEERENEADSEDGDNNSKKSISIKQGDLDQIGNDFGLNPNPNYHIGNGNNNNNGGISGTNNPNLIGTNINSTTLPHGGIDGPNANSIMNNSNLNNNTVLANPTLAYEYANNKQCEKSSTSENTSSSSSSDGSDNEEKKIKEKNMNDEKSNIIMMINNKKPKKFMSNNNDLGSVEGGLKRQKSKHIRNKQRKKAQIYDYNKEEQISNCFFKRVRNDIVHIQKSFHFMKISAQTLDITEQLMDKLLVSMEFEGCLVSSHRHKMSLIENKKEISLKQGSHILKILKETGLNENFIINYKELTFTRKIGEGGYGEVYLGKFSGIDVAVKQYGKRRLDHRRAEDFVKEVDVISNLRHPNIVLYMGACIHEGKYLMITEYLEQGSLFDHLHIKHTKFNEEQMFNIIEDIALGMTYLHGRKVLHCDLKSSNILIDSNWGVKLCDFGLSRIKSKNKKRRSGRMGTPHWMAPEILRSENYDESSDVYSFGMILWELVTGEIPYHHMPISEIVVNVGYEGKQIQIPTKGNHLILSIIRKCLDLDRKNRPTFKEILEGFQQKTKEHHKKSNIFNYLKFRLSLSLSIINSKYITFYYPEQFYVITHGKAVFNRFHSSTFSSLIC